MQTASEVAALWKDRLLRSGDKIKSGVRAVKEAPTQRAARKKSEYVAGVMRAVDSGKWEQGLGRVTLQQWQDAMINKGVANLTTGATQAMPKVEAFLSRLLPYTAQVKETIAQMPKGTIEDGKARALAAIDMMAAFKRA